MSSADQSRPTLGDPESPLSYTFGPFVLDTFQHALLKEGKPVALTPKTYDTLLVLVRNSGRMLSKQELMKTLWPNSVVEESNLTQQVSMIRRALGDSASDPRYIATVPGRGYRFMAQVRNWTDERLDSELSDSPAEVASEPADRTSRPRSEIARDQDIAASSPPQSPLEEVEDRKTSQRAIPKLAIFGLLVLACFVIGRSVYQSRSRPEQSQAPPRSLAILPLQNIKQDPDEDFLGFSLADAIITKLDNVSALTLRPSTDVQKYRGQVIDIQRVAADLKVDTLLTGSFVRDGNDLRITYQLIDVKSDKILGRGKLDLKYDNLLRVQDNVAQQIIQELELNLSHSEAERIKPDASVKPLAYEYYLRGVDLHGQHKFSLAIKMLEKSIEIDSNFAPAWAYLGASYTSDATFEFGGREQYRRAQAAYERAIALQPSQLDAHLFLANLLVDTGKVEHAVQLLRDALKTHPNDAALHWELGYAYRFAGMLNESVTECERARQLDPLVKSNGSALNAYLYLGEYDKFLRSLPDVNDSAFFLFYRGFGEYHQKNFERAAKDFDRAFDLDPSLYAQIGKAISNAIAHRDADGLEILHGLEAKISARGVGDPEATYKIAQAYSILGDKTSALRVLKHSVEGGFFSYPYIATDPLLGALHQELEFTRILGVARQRYEAFKKAAGPPAL